MIPSVSEYSKNIFGIMNVLGLINHRVSMSVVTLMAIHISSIVKFDFKVLLRLN